MPGDKEGASAADTIAAAAAASKYTVPDEETFILRATAGLYPGEISKVFQDKDLATNPVGVFSIPVSLIHRYVPEWTLRIAGKAPFSIV